MPRKTKLKFSRLTCLKITGLLLLIVCGSTSFSQTKRSTFIQPEYTVGRIIPNYQENFPTSIVQQGLAINFGSINTDTTSWAKYYNYAEAGVMLLYTNFGNNTVFGHQFGLVPYISFPIFNPLKGNYHLKLGLGIAAFSTYYDSIQNPTNNIIGAPISWDFKAFLYRDIYQTETFNLIAGIGLSHESNGHTSLPNLGINTALFSLSGQFYTRQKQATPSRLKGRNWSPKKGFVYVRQEIGFHEQSKSEGPKSGVKKGVYGTAVAVGITYNKHLKLRTGLNYKFYNHYYTYLKENEVEGLQLHPKLNGSAVVLFVGSEFLMSHFSIDTEVGFNLHKPFYKAFHKEKGTLLMRYLTARLGINAYLFNTNLLPKHNISLGAHLNTNLGKADFTAFSFRIHV